MVGRIVSMESIESADEPSPSPARSLAARVLAFACATALLVALAWQAVPAGKACPDFIQFWTAATLLAERSDPYDAEAQATVQGGLGWDQEKDGYGLYAFLPYYYPPWLGLAVVPMLPLGFGLARVTWLVLGGQMLLASGWLLKDRVSALAPPLVLVVVATFGFSIKAVAMGQVAPLVLLLTALAWKLLAERRDGQAGLVLALLTIKPQLTVLLMLVLLGWSARQGRWAVWKGFAAGVAGLVAVSTAAFPWWLPSMLAATSVTPMPTAYYPGTGATWYVALGALGLDGVLLHAAYLSLALPLLLALLRATVQGHRSLDDLVGLSLIVPFFVVPYARAYDFPILLIPALTLMGRYLSPLSRAMMAFALIVLPTFHIVRIAAATVPPVVGVTRPEFTTIWIPFLIGAVWLCCVPDGGSQEKVAAKADRE